MQYHALSGCLKNVYKILCFKDRCPYTAMSLQIPALSETVKETLTLGVDMWAQPEG
jgi:hypothetical protein